MANSVNSKINLSINVDEKNAVKAMTNVTEVIGKILRLTRELLDSGKLKNSTDINNIVSKFDTLNNALKSTNLGNVISQLGDLNNKLSDLQDTVNNVNTQNLDDLGDLKVHDGDIEILKNAFGDLGDIINSIASNLGINTSKFQQLGQVLSQLSPEGKAALGSIMLLATTFKLLYKETDDVYNKLMDFSKGALKNIADSFGDAVFDGVDLFTDALGNMKDMIAEAIESLKELSDIGIEANDALFVMNNYLGTEGAEQLSTYIDTLGALKGVDVKNTEKSLKSLFGSLQNMNLNNDEFQQYTSSFVKFMNDISAYQNVSFESVAQQMEAAISFKTLNSRSALAKSLNLTSEMIEQFKELGTVEERAQWILARWPVFAGKYDEWLQTDQGKVTSLKNNWQNLMNSVGQLALKVYATIAPLLDHLVSLINYALKGLLNLLNKDISKDKSKDINNTASAYDSLADSVANVGKSAEKSNKQTASFDDVIQLNDNKSNIDTSGLSNFSSVLSKLNKDLDDTKTEFEKLLDAVKEAVNNKEFYEAGKMISDYFADQLEAIDWNNIKDKAKEYGNGLGEFINGIIDNMRLWKNIGKTVAESLNSLNTFLYNLGSEIHWDSLGEGIAKSWTSYWETLDANLFADTIYTWINGIFTAFESAINNMWTEMHWVDDNGDGIYDGVYNGFELVGHKIAMAVNRFFEDFDELDAVALANGIVDFIVGVFTSAGTFLDQTNWSEITNRLGTILSNIIAGLSEHTGELAQSLSDILTGVLNFVNEDVFSEENLTNIVNGISSFITTAFENIDDWAPIIGNIVTKIIDAIEEMRSNGTISKIYDSIEKILSDAKVGDLVYEIMLLEIEYKLRTWWMSTWTKICSVVKFLYEGAKSTVTALISIIGILFFWIIDKGGDLFASILLKKDEIYNSISDTVYKILGKFTNMPDEIKKSISDIVTIIVSPFSSAKKKILEMFNNFNPFEKLKSNTKLSFDLSSLWSGPRATGGITNGPSIGMIGEDGREAVLPLDKNTGWMDGLATKIASKLGTNNSVNTPTINIDMSKANKEFYTRSEYIAGCQFIVDSLRTGGYKVQLS